jgi:hypothetical protein
MNLNESLQALTAAFVDNIVAAISGASIDEILGTAGTHSATVKEPKTVRRTALIAKTSKVGMASKASAKEDRLPRRSLDQINEVVEDVARLLKSGPMRAEEIRDALNLDRREIPRVIKLGLDTKQIKILSGQKRSTTYGLPGGKTASKKAPKKAAAKKPARKVAAKKTSKARKTTNKTTKKPAAKTKKSVKRAAKAPTPPVAAATDTTAEAAAE